MRKFIMLMERSMEDALFDEPVQDTEGYELDEQVEVNVEQRLEEIIFRCRSHSDDTGGDYSFGFESGLEMAAEMIENLLNAIKESKGEKSES